MKYFPLILIVLLFVLLAACGSGGSIPATATGTPTMTITATTDPLPTSTIGSTPTFRPTLSPDAWKSWPIIPVVSPRMVEVYETGLAAGRNPLRFSKIGDCQNVIEYFLSYFDYPGRYRLGSSYADLQATIDQFSGSWSRESLAVKPGMNVAAVLNPFWADQTKCNKNESPLACEIRVYKPTIAIISMETWWANKSATDYEKYLRQVVEYALSQNVIPILGTKADNLEGDYSINQVIVRVAYEYNVPLWNFWAATDPLPAHGLRDGFHLTITAPQHDYIFDDPENMKTGWPWRNLTALQAIDAVYRAVSSQP